MKRIVFLLLLVHSSLLSFSQNGDSLALNKDTAAVHKSNSVPDTSYIKRRANRAAIYSAILPGAGQAYNKKYWKIPILYAGIAGLAISIHFNDTEYNSFKKAYIQRIHGQVDQYKTIFPDSSSLLVRKDYYRRTRDLMYIFSAVVYILNIVDAYVDAHLANFDVSDNLSFHATPCLQFAKNEEPVASLALSLSFR